MKRILNASDPRGWGRERDREVGGGEAEMEMLLDPSSCVPSVRPSPRRRTGRNVRSF